jgi:hypothetical protein
VCVSETLVVVAIVVFAYLICIISIYKCVWLVPTQLEGVVKDLHQKHMLQLKNMNNVLAVECTSKKLPPLLYSTEASLKVLTSKTTTRVDVDDDDEDDDEFVDVTGSVVWDCLRIFWNHLSAEDGEEEYHGSEKVSSDKPWLNRSLVNGKRVLELGAGSGLLGIG